MSGRPRGDRAARITSTAARLFRERGFHATTIDDIGRAEGVSGPAIYRHFAGKDDLLAAVVLRGVRHINESFAAVADRDVDPEERVALVVAAGGRAVIDDLDSIMVHLREGRHLPHDRRADIAAGADAVNDVYIAAVQAARPELSRRHVGFMLQSLSGMYLSLGHFHLTTSRERLEEIWTTMGTAALLAAPDVDVDVGRSSRDGVVPRARASRREEILAQATALFRERGFGGVGIDDIGSAVGIAGPALYHYFDSKDELLAAAMSRGGEQLAASVSKALAATSPEETLDRLVESYVQIAIEHADTIAVYLAEVESLTVPRRRGVRRDQRAYVDEWHAVVSELAPGQSPDDVRAAVHAAIGLGNGYAQGRVRPPVDVASAILQAMTKGALDAFIASRPPAR